MVNQGAITQCLPVAPLPIHDSRQNPRVLVAEPRVWKEGNTPRTGPSSLLPTPWYVSQLLAAPGGAAQGRNWQRGSSTLRESREPRLIAPYPYPCLIPGCQLPSPAQKPKQWRKTGAALLSVGRAPSAPHIHMCLQAEHCPPLIHKLVFADKVPSPHMHKCWQVEHCPPIHTCVCCQFT